MLTRRAPLEILLAGSLPPYPGGSAVANYRLLSAWARAGHGVRALGPATAKDRAAASAFDAAHPAPVLTRYEVPYVTADAVGEWLSAEQRRSQRAALRRVFDELVAQVRPDIVLIARGDLLLDVPEVAAAHAVPWAVIQHGAVVHGLRDGAFPDALRDEYLRRFAEGSAVITATRHMARDLHELGCSPVHIVPNPVDVDHFRPCPPDAALRRALGIPDGASVVLHASNMKACKRVLDLVDSAAAVMERRPQTVYLVAGDGPGREAMERRAAQLGIGAGMRFAGWIAQDALPDYMNLADVVVMPSEVENQSLVYLEACACARALLASDIPGARETLRDGETGMLFRKGDVEDLTAKTVHLLADGALRERLGRSAREAVGVHASDAVAEAYAEILSGIVTAPAARRP